MTMFTINMTVGGQDGVEKNLAKALGIPTAAQMKLIKANVIEALLRMGAGAASAAWKQKFATGKYPRDGSSSKVADTWESIYRNAPNENAIFVKGSDVFVIGSRVLYEQAQVYGWKGASPIKPMPIETSQGTIFRMSTKGGKGKGPFHVDAAKAAIEKRAEFAFDYAIEHFMQTGQVLSVDQILSGITVGV